jgi:hypothetical protein
MTVATFIQDNICTVRKLVQIGRVPLCLMTDYDIYLMFKAIDYEPKQMKRYAIVASKLKVSVASVRKAVSSMEKKC